MCLYTCAFDPTVLIHQRSIQRFEYIGLHSAGPITVERAENFVSCSSISSI